MATYADLDESQVLSCARDVLLSCNRTQSGGDTYYTVESLFVNRDFAVLTPFACEADPLEIVVDIVESEKRRLANMEEQDNSECESVSNPARAHGYQYTSGTTQLAAGYDILEAELEHGRYDLQGRHSDHSRITDYTTESSGNTHSASEDEESKEHRGMSSRHLTPYSPGAFAMHYDGTELPSDIIGATALPSAVLSSRDRPGKGKTSSMSSGGFSIASGSTESTEAEATHSSPDETRSPSRPISMGRVELPSMLESRESIGLQLHIVEGRQRSGERAVMGGKHRRHRTEPESLPVPAAVTAGHGEDETIAMSELTLDSNLQQKKQRKASALKKAMQFVSPAGKNSDIKAPMIGVAATEKNRFFNKFGASSPIPLPTPVSSVDDSSASHGCTGGESPKVTRKKKNLLRRAFGGKGDHDRDKESATSSPCPEKEGHKRGRRHKRHDVHSDTDDEESAAQSMCVRIQVIAKSKYRLCNLDPQNDHDDNWAVISGNFHQVFFLKSNSNGRPSVSDRLITARIEKV
ncbi:unnamed protein product [Symbiodinium microadriaticum]|nr:unnamed protein product [Symbiodinium microadriaticum]